MIVAELHTRILIIITPIISMTITLRHNNYYSPMTLCVLFSRDTQNKNSTYYLIDEKKLSKKR